MKKLLLLLVVGIVLINLASATIDLGTLKQGECIQLKQTCDSCSFVTLTEVYRSGQNTTTWDINTNMTKNGVKYNYTWCDTTVSGDYQYTTLGDKDGNLITEEGYFSITFSGNKLDTQKSILYIGLIVILIFIFLLIIFVTPKLPSKDVMTEDGIILDINNLKYLRPVLWGVAWGVLLGIVFITSNISLAYLPTAMFGNFFFVIFRIMLMITPIMFILWFIYIFLKIFRDKETKRLLERGVEIRGTP